MKVTPREIVLTVVTLTAILFGGTAIVARPKFEQWKELRAKQTVVRGEIERDLRLIDVAPSLDQELRDLVELLPLHPAGRNVDAHWLKVMDDIATKNGLNIQKRNSGGEKDLGDVYEFAIECRDWEGTLDSLVRFLFDLQAEGGMFDIRYLWIKPKEKQTLRGHFTLYCAYTREKASS